MRWNEINWNKKGATSRSAGYGRAQRWFKPGPCVDCGNSKSEYHHIDGNPLNNNPANVKRLCRSCHMKTDGRIAKLVHANRLRALRKLFKRENGDATF